MNLKFLIMADAIFTLIVSIIYYIVSLTEVFFQQIGVMQLMSRYFGIYMMIYFVFKKASKPIPNKTIWINYGLRPLIIISFIFNIILSIFMEV